MDSVRRVPLWLWWVIGIAAIAAISAAAVFFVRSNHPALPPGLVEKRAALAQVLEEANRIEDVDIKPLLEFETKKDYTGAVALMMRALEANSTYEANTVVLVRVSEELTRLAVEVKPDEAGTKAVEAFGLLAKLAQTERTFYANRRILYKITRDYYAALAAKQNPPIPENLRALVETVNADLSRAKKLQQQFAAAIKAFDDVIAGR